jgi:hypothetical protein
MPTKPSLFTKFPHFMGTFGIASIKLQALENWSELIVFWKQLLCILWKTLDASGHGVQTHRSRDKEVSGVCELIIRAGAG